jgi:DNA primase
VAQVPQNTIADVLDRIDIVQLVGEYVTLRKAGVNYVGLCPFHNEKSPSFNVNPARRIFHCFGCQKGGDAIKFLQEIEGLNFPEALERLAGRAGIELPKREERQGKSQQEKAHQQSLLELNRIALEYYRENLRGVQGRKAKEYLEDRGVQADQWERHQLGYALPIWDGLYRFFLRQKASIPLAVEVGLLVAKAENRYYDRFRDRIMFPVLAQSGEVIGFSGRTLDAEAKEAKYLNSPESVVFKKGEGFLGLFFARNAIRKARSAVLVEGNFDYLSLQERGAEEAVAPMGTALTPSQVRVLRRFSGETVILLYDGDSAGEKASRRAIPLILEGGLFPKVAALPSGEDPDTFARKRSPEELRAFLGAAKDAVEHLIEQAAQKTRGDIPARARAAEEIAQVIACVRDEVAKDLYLKHLAERLGVSGNLLQKTVRAVRPEAQARPEPPPAREPGEDVEEAPEPAPKHELLLAGLLFVHPNLRPKAKAMGISRFASHRGVKELLVLFENASPEEKDTNLLASVADDGIKQALLGVLAQPLGLEDEPHKAEERLIQTGNYLYKKALERKIAELDAAIKVAKAEGDEDRVFQLLDELARVRKAPQDLLRRLQAKALPS